MENKIMTKDQYEKSESAYIGIDGICFNFNGKLYRGSYICGELQGFTEIIVKEEVEFIKDEFLNEMLGLHVVDRRKYEHELIKELLINIEKEG